MREKRYANEGWQASVSLAKAQDVRNIATMKPSLQAEIKQEKPFASLYQEVFLNLSRTAAVASHVVEQRLRPFGLSLTQYNVLRILRGAGEAALVQCEVGVRLVAQVPDVPRILSRMEKAGWIERVRSTRDRRMVYVKVCPKGLDLVNGLDDSMQMDSDDLFGALNAEEMGRLNELLVKARCGAASNRVGLPTSDNDAV